MHKGMKAVMRYFDSEMRLKAFHVARDLLVSVVLPLLLRTFILGIIFGEYCDHAFAGFFAKEGHDLFKILLKLGGIAF